MQRSRRDDVTQQAIATYVQHVMESEAVSREKLADHMQMSLDTFRRVMRGQRDLGLREFLLLVRFPAPELAPDDLLALLHVLEATIHTDAGQDGSRPHNSNKNT